MENKLPGYIDVAHTNTKFCLDKADFYGGKSRAKNAEKETREWQKAAERWAATEELLRELAQYRNYAKRHPEIIEQVRQGMISQGYDY